ncbi:MAG: TonB family protein [Candidatus Sulfotelmatobacter sp.]
MPLRCLLFSSNEETFQPISQVLADLGIEGEYCRSAVDAVERVTTQLFQIVITDWADQPEATFLLKTARDQKAAQRPLTLAIVNDDATLPEALQAGANSVLVKPIRPEQVRDTMTTACELLRAKQSPPAPRPADPTTQPTAKEPIAMAAAAAGTASVSVSASVPSEAEKTFRAGEFLQSSTPAPGAQFVTESEIQKSLDHAAASEVDALTELEPMAASVETAPAPPENPRNALDGWASLQARLTRSIIPASPTPSSSEPPPQNELLGFGETPSFGATTAPSTQQQSSTKHSQSEAESEAALFSYMSGEGSEPALNARPKRSRTFVVSMLAVAGAVLVAMAIPQTRQKLTSVYRNASHASKNWLNPQPVQVPQVVTQHESFGQEGDEYKLPVVANIPDATTDPSQIRVLPVIDPTAKPANAASIHASTGPNAAADETQQAAAGSEPAQVVPTQVEQVNAPAASSATNVAAVPQAAVAPAVQLDASSTMPQSASAQLRPITAQVQTFAPHPVPSGPATSIPSSLRSQLASSTPEASGNKAEEAAMSSIEPVKLPETAAWNLLTQPVDPIYPDSAKASGQRGSVVLQVLIGHDGTVQDAKFLQGSLIFARAAIDAVKQWHFKPYILNGRVVSIQSLITLNFKPPA